MSPNDLDAWEASAEWWQQGFAGGVDAEYTEQILPLAAEHARACSRVLDIGSGEGQLSRHIAHAANASVIGIDPSWAQVSAAHNLVGGPTYVRAEARHLPFPDASFDGALACLVLEHVDDLDGCISEVGRVLANGGRFLFFLNHPLLQTPNSGWIDDHILEEQYWRIGPYLPEDRTLEEVDKDVFLPFVHRPLSRYVNALAENGLLVTEMHEPSPPPGFLSKAPEYSDAATIPRLLFLRAEKLRGVNSSTASVEM